MNRPWRWWRDWLLVGAIVLTVSVAVGGCAYTFFIPMGK